MNQKLVPPNQWGPFCACGRRKKPGRGICRACKAMEKAMRKGNQRKIAALAQCHPIFIVGDKTYKRVGNMLRSL